MNDTYYYVASGSCALVGIMDRLWFGQLILFPDHPGSEQSSVYEFADLDPNEDSPSHHVITTCDESDEASDQSRLSMEESYKNEEEDNPWPKRGFTDCNNSDDQVARTNSLSPSVAKDKGRGLRKWFSYSDPKSLHKMLSCWSLEDLEMEEVKGFMDLGFVFDKEHLSRRMMSVIPGLQRLGLAASDDVGDVDEKGISVIEGDKIRPYLSEAWLVRGADSPLLKLRIPDKVCASADMKKHLKRWARTVASSVEFQSYGGSEDLQMEMQTGRNETASKATIPDHNGPLPLVLSRFEPIGIDTRFPRFNIVDPIRVQLPEGPVADMKWVEYARSHAADREFNPTVFRRDNENFHEQFGKNLLILSENNPLTGENGGDNQERLSSRQRPAVIAGAE